MSSHPSSGPGARHHATDLGLEVATREAELEEPATERWNRLCRLVRRIAARASRTPSEARAAGGGEGAAGLATVGPGTK